MIQGGSFQRTSSAKAASHQDEIEGRVQGAAPHRTNECCDEHSDNRGIHPEQQP